MNRRICVVTGTRAEYGLLRWVIAGLHAAPDIECQLVVTAMHLSPEFGLTFRAIESEGFTITRKVEMLLSTDTPSGITKSMGLGMIGFADAFNDLRPDLLLILGDRFEILSAAATALIHRIPVAHIHGGEITEGAFDDAIRHSITKMSHLHFVAAEEHRRRIEQLGEQPDKVFVVGGLGVDNIKKLKLLDREQLETQLGMNLGPRSILVTFHPATLDEETPAQQMSELLAALETLQDTTIIFTMPNADTAGRALFKLIDEFVASHPTSRAYTSLGQLLYLSCMRHVDGVVGNSSSGLLEAPSFPKGAVNIGTRQGGRLRAANVIDCVPERQAIERAISRLYSPEFAEQLAGVTNPYGDGGASEKIVDVVRHYPLRGLLKKRFHDMEFHATVEAS